MERHGRLSRLGARDNVEMSLEGAEMYPHSDFLRLTTFATLGRDARGARNSSNLKLRIKSARRESLELRGS